MMKNLILTIALGLTFTNFAQADNANYLKANVNIDFTDSHNPLPKPKDIKIDTAFVIKYNGPQFYSFLGNDDINSVCFVGSPSKALDVIDEVLSITTGDAFVYPSKNPKETPNLVSRSFRVDAENGTTFKTISIRRCKN